MGEDGVGRFLVLGAFDIHATVEVADAVVEALGAIDQQGQAGRVAPQEGAALVAVGTGDPGDGRECVELLAFL